MTQPSEVESKMVDKSGNPQIGDRQSAITAVTESVALNSTFSDTEVEAAINVNAVAINLLITRLEGAGIIADN